MRRPLRLVLAALVIILVLVIPRFMPSGYHMYIVDMTGINIILVVGLNFVIGFAGQLSLAQIAFWGIGAYTSAILTVDYGWPFWAALVAAVLVATSFGVMLAYPTARLKGRYLALTTMAFALATRIVFLNYKDLTHGPAGISNIPKARLLGLTFGNYYSSYYLILVVAALIVVGSARIRYSRLGRALEALREDELAARSMGINTATMKILAFGLSAACAGLAGSLYAHMMAFISPDNFTLDEMVKIMCMLFIGGSGSVDGPVIGAILLTIIPEWLRFLREYYRATYGAAMVLMMIFMPAGLSGLYRTLRDRMVARRRREIGWAEMSRTPEV